MKPELFPLSWPPGYPVTEKRQESKFICTMAQARDGIISELAKLGAKEPMISTNVQVDKRGMLPASGRLVYDNPGVAVYFKFRGEDKVVACDKWLYLHENMRAVEKSIEAIRGLERWGCSDIISRAMGGMKALSQNAGESHAVWYIIMGINQESSWEEIDSKYKQLVKIYHPDRVTGDRDMFDLIQKAYNEAKLKFKKS